MAGSIKADFFFGEPQNMGQVINSSSSDYGACVSTDGLELYFCSERPGGFGAGDIWISIRKTVNDPWDQPTNLGSTVNSPYSDSYPSLSSDGLTLYFSDVYSGSPRSGGLGGGDIWITTRPSLNAPWVTPGNLGAPINSSSLDMSPSISKDGLTLIFTSNNRAGGHGSWDLWMSTRVSEQDPWSPPINLGSSVNSGDWDGECSLSGDGLVVFFGSGRVGIAGAIDLWMSARKTLADQWSTTINLGPVINSSSNDGTARVSSNMKTLYFCSNRPDNYGSYDLFEAPIIPVVDLNGDGIVDAADMCTIVDYWGEDYPLCDIGPAPWGDGKVDSQDLIILSEYLFEEVKDPTLVAYWKLDEADGIIAYDSAGVNDAVVVGGTEWQSGGGQINGALQLDGIDGYAITAPVLNPTNGPFSVFVWIKGGAPGQVILSQTNGANWLGADSDFGCIMTELIPPAVGRFVPQPLKSESIITDGQWHRIGFVWDGVNRSLYVDDILVAEDTQDNLQGSDGGLYIGAGKATEPGTYWSGLIDDVRIYNRVVRP
ncbi:MAG: LamG-like jellyroll fold domain-containing protein [Planctomycetota bacterium]